MHASRCLNESEQNCSKFERELLSVLFALKRFRPYPLSESFVLFADLYALRNAFNRRDPRRMISRWMNFPIKYDFETKYISREENGTAKYLMR